MIQTPSTQIPTQDADLDKSSCLQLIDDTLKNLNQLRPFPSLASQLLDVCNRSDSNIKDVIQLVECEPAVSSKVISLANSPLYGVRRPIETIGHAIVVLGMRAVSQLAVSIVAGQVFSKGEPAVRKHREQVFSESLGCATVARMLSRKLNLGNPDSAFLCGTMHDVGKLVLFDTVPIQYASILESNAPEETVPCELERFGYDHASIGKRCSDKWGLPFDISTAIASHHMALDEVDHELSRVTLIATYLSKAWGVGFAEPERLRKRDELVQVVSALPIEEMQELALEQYLVVSEICAPN